jgi:multidrug efflux pump subunit AcrA (membrane-fusion protein)
VLRIGAPDPTRLERLETAAEAPISGTGFLQAKADAKRAVAARSARVREDAGAARDALQQFADATRVRPVENAGTLMIDAAFLVRPDQVDAMRETLTQRAERLLRDGCPVSLTGPWPPYSFAAMEADG